jgi:aspartate carbamoyltransferase catalytic subunit
VKKRGKKTVVFSRKDFIGLRGMSAEEINYILETAETMKLVLGQRNKKAPHLQGKSVIFLFYDKSSKAKLSYQLAAQYLSAVTVDMDPDPQVSSMAEMGKVIDQMGGDFIVIRHPMAGTAKLLGESAAASVINAGDGLNENPSQSLLNLLTIKDEKGSFNGLKVTIIGDIAHSRVAKSDIWGLCKLGAKVTVAGPPTLIPPNIEDLGVKVVYDRREAAEGADVIMALRMQWERQSGNLMPSPAEYRQLFMVDRYMLRYAKDDVIVMHPGPVNLGTEISYEVIESDKCLIEDQITNGVAVRMAVLYLLSLKGGMLTEAFN